MTDREALEREEQILKLCRGIFNTGNLIGTDFDDFQAFEVTNRNFPQQPGGGGIHVSFSISWHAIGKTGRDAHEALEVLMPDTDD